MLTLKLVDSTYKLATPNQYVVQPLIIVSYATNYITNYSTNYITNYN